MNNVKLIGIGGVATSGKDLFFNISKEILRKNGHSAIRLAFADEVKKDLDPFLLEKVGISAFTSNPEEKKLIRPFIVAYSTTLMRKLKPNIWIEKLRYCIDNMEFKDNDVLFITDVRFENELLFIQNVYEGETIHIKKYNNVDGGFDKSYISPANEEEAANDPLVEKYSNFRLEWENIEKRYVNFRRDGEKQDYASLVTNEYLNDVVLEYLNKTKYFNALLTHYGTD